MCFATGSPHVPPHSAFPRTELIHYTDSIAYQQLQQLRKWTYCPDDGVTSSWFKFRSTAPTQGDSELGTKPTSSKGCSVSRNAPQEAYGHGNCSPPQCWERQHLNTPFLKEWIFNNFMEELLFWHLDHHFNSSELCNERIKIQAWHWWG